MPVFISLIVVLLNVFSAPASEIQAEIPTSECPDGKEYQECGSACPLTCGQPDLVPCLLVCVPGCFCPSGQYLSGDKCVSKEECPSISKIKTSPSGIPDPSTPAPGGCDCNYNGTYCYNNGSRFHWTVGCSACFCRNGSVSCFEQACFPLPTTRGPFTGCIHSGVKYRNGDRFRSEFEDGYDDCVCSNDGFACARTVIDNVGRSAGCFHKEKHYRDGDIFKLDDECITCVCVADQISCTETKPCPTQATLTRSMLHASCAYDGKCYKQGDSFNSTDGCNICNCYNGRASCTKEFCYHPISCPENMEFRNCSHHMTCQQPEVTISGNCVPGCFCRRGFFEYKGSCVKKRGCSVAKCKPKRTKETVSEDGCRSVRKVNIWRCSGFCANSQTACQTEKMVTKFTRFQCSGGRRRIPYVTAVKCSCSSCNPYKSSTSS